MVDYFTDANKDAPHRVKPAKKSKDYFTDANAGERKDAPREEVRQPEWWEGPAGFGMDVLRNFNDTLTFGGYPAFLEMTGLDPNAQESLEASDPWAGVIGDTLGYMLPGGVASKAVGAAIKTLGRNTIPAIVGREGIASGTVSAVDGVARGEGLDPTQIAIDTALGAAGGGVLSGALALTGRGLSSGARVRGMGGELDPLDLEKAKMFSDYASEKGVTLNNVEAVKAVAPTKSAVLEQGLAKASGTPAGNARLASFNASRSPEIMQVGKDIVDDLGGGIPPNQVQDAATAAMQRNRDMVRESAAPYYADAEPRRVPPSWVPKDGYTGMAIRDILQDPGAMKGLTLHTATPANPKGSPPASNSILFLDAVKKDLDTRSAQAFDRGDATRGGYAKDEAEALLARMDQIAPTYPVAREISEQGGAAMDVLQQGPLGTLTQTPTTAGQGRLLFGADNAVNKRAASVAARNLPDEVPVGVLANLIDSASNKPNWANKALPTDTSMELADEALQRAGKDDIAGPLGAARAVDPTLGDPAPHNNTGLGGAVYTGLREIGSKGVADKLIDPKWIERIGKMGPWQTAATRAAVGGVQAGIQGSRNRRKKKKKD